MKKHVYNAVAVYFQARDNITLEDVSSTQQHEEDHMIPKRVKKQQVPRKDARSAIPVLN